jgi:hypothetical protein
MIMAGYPDGEVRDITEERLPWSGQPWSPDGNKFIFWNEDGPASQHGLVMVDLLTGETQRLGILYNSKYFWSQTAGIFCIRNIVVTMML